MLYLYLAFQIGMKFCPTQFKLANCFEFSMKYLPAKLADKSQFLKAGIVGPEWETWANDEGAIQTNTWIRKLSCNVLICCNVCFC